VQRHKCNILAPLLYRVPPRRQQPDDNDATLPLRSGPCHTLLRLERRLLLVTVTWAHQPDVYAEMEWSFAIVHTGREYQRSDAATQGGTSWAGRLISALVGSERALTDYPHTLELMPHETLAYTGRGVLCT
jgi:hypothetical protein